MKCPKCDGRFSLVRDVCPNPDCNGAKLKLVESAFSRSKREVGRPTTRSVTSSGHTVALFDLLHDSHRSWMFRSVLPPPATTGMM